MEGGREIGTDNAGKLNANTEVGVDEDKAARENEVGSAFRQF